MQLAPNALPLGHQDLLLFHAFDAVLHFDIENFQGPDDKDGQRQADDGLKDQRWNPQDLLEGLGVNQAAREEGDGWGQQPAKDGIQEQGDASGAQAGDDVRRLQRSDVAEGLLAQPIGRQQATREGDEVAGGGVGDVVPGVWIRQQTWQDDQDADDIQRQDHQGDIVQPVPLARLEQGHAKLEQADEGDAQEQQMHHVQDLNPDRGQVGLMHGSKQLAPFVQAVVDAEGG